MARLAAIRFLRGPIWSAIYRIGALSLYHWFRNRDTLTVVAFHRILRRDDARWETALVPWTLDDETFDHCLAFFKRHYTIVTLDDVRRSLDRKHPLPARSLLITFDDGFADNLDYAVPMLRKHGASAAVFITSDTIGREERLWTEDLLWAVTRGLISPRQLARLHALLTGENSPPDSESLVWDIVHRAPELDDGTVHAALAALAIDLPRISHPPQMLTREQITTLIDTGMAIGAHGKTHTALPFSSDLAAELCGPRAALNEIVAASGRPAIDALSFPHGLYTAQIAEQAIAVGYRLLFTGEPELCALDDGFVGTPRIGRIDVDVRRIAPDGRFRPEILATSLFTARRQQPDRSASPLTDHGHAPTPRGVPRRASLVRPRDAVTRPASNARREAR